MNSCDQAQKLIPTQAVEFPLQCLPAIAQRLHHGKQNLYRIVYLGCLSCAAISKLLTQHPQLPACSASLALQAAAQGLAFTSAAFDSTLPACKESLRRAKS